MSRDRWLDDDGEERTTSRVSSGDDQDKGRFVGLLILLLGVYFVLERATGTDLRLFPFLATAFFGALAWRGTTWAWIPTALFSVSVFSQIGGAFAASDLMLPTVFVVGGGMLLLREHIPAVTRKIIFLVLGIMALGAIFGNDDDHDPNPQININVNGDRGRAVDQRNANTIPDINGRELVIQGSSADVEIIEGPRFEVSGGRTVRSTDKQVLVVAAGSGTLSVTAPEDSAIRVVTQSGDVSAEGGWESLTIASSSGDVDVEWTALGDPNLTIATQSGAVDVDLLGDPDVRVTTSSGDIDLEGYEGDDDPDKVFVHDGPDSGAVVVQTQSGDVDVMRRDRELR